MAYTEKTVNNYLVGESEVLAMNGTTDVPGPVITTDLSGKKIVMGVNVSVAGGASAATFEIQYSHDGTNWTAVTEISSDIDADVIGVKSFLVDLTTVAAPYYRLVLGGVTSLGTTGRFTLFYAARGLNRA